MVSGLGVRPAESEGKIALVKPPGKVAKIPLHSGPHLSVLEEYPKHQLIYSDHDSDGLTLSTNSMAIYRVRNAAGSELVVPVIAELGTSDGGFLATTLSALTSLGLGLSDSVSSPLSSSSELSVSLSSELLSS